MLQIRGRRKLKSQAAWGRKPNLGIHCDLSDGYGEEKGLNLASLGNRGRRVIEWGKQERLRGGRGKRRQWALERWG
jgi:hypothetical protein